MNYCFAFLLCLATLPLTAQSTSADQAKQYAEDVSSLDQIMAALYASISGEAGEPRDWDRFRHLFTEEARLMPSGIDEGGTVDYRILSPDDYVETSGSWLEENGFYEVEIHREVAEYGSLVHAFSTYESYRSKADAEPFARGINSIQLLNDGQRWWILHIYWLAETEELPLPAAYLPRKD